VGSPVEERYRHTGASAAKGCDDDCGLGASDNEEKLRELLFGLEERRFRSVLPRCRNTWWEGAKKLEPCSSQWCTVAGQESEGTSGNTENSI